MFHASELQRLEFLGREGGETRHSPPHTHPEFTFKLSSRGQGSSSLGALEVHVKAHEKVSILNLKEHVTKNTLWCLRNRYALDYEKALIRPDPSEGSELGLRCFIKKLEIYACAYHIQVFFDCDRSMLQPCTEVFIVRVRNCQKVHSPFL